jgi:hypothetical protein
MKQHDERRTSEQHRRRPPRKPFAKPELIVYGDIAALTQAVGQRGMHDGVPFGLTKTG